MILMIDNYDSFTWNLVQAFRGLGADMKVVRNDELDVAGIASLSPEAIVFSPGPGNPDGAGVTLAAVREFAGKIPLLGICLGHQSIAQAFGARIVRAKRLMHGKTSRLHHDGRGLFAGLPQGFEAMRYHSLAVERASLPDCFEISAEAEDGEIMGLRHKTLPIESLQYHPESIGTPLGEKQLANFLAGVTGKRPKTAADRTERKAILARALEGVSPGEAEAEAFFAAVLAGDVPETELAAFLTALAKTPVTAVELAGAARAMRGAGVKLDIGEAAERAVDIVGTGGDGSNSFNVSTCAAFIAAGAGVVVAKHGNVASSSQCGSADVLKALGCNLSAPPAAVERCIRETGVGFLFARELHPAMRFAAPVRKMLGFRTLFNLLGPLTNPAGVGRNVIGVPQERLAPVFAQALGLLGSTRAWVVSGSGGIDEISPGGFSFVSELRDGAVKTRLLDAAGEYGAAFPNEELRGADAAFNAARLLAVLKGEERGACRAAAIENAAAAILVADAANSYRDAIAAAADALDSGRALCKLRDMIDALA